MHGLESGLNARRRTPPSVMPARPVVYVRCSLPPRDIADLAVYHRGPRGCGLYLALLVAAPLRRYAGRCCSCSDTAGPARARETQRPNPQRIVHTVLIGIHCRGSDLCRGLPTECRPDLFRYPGVPAPVRISLLVPRLTAFVIWDTRD